MPRCRSPIQPSRSNALTARSQDRRKRRHQTGTSTSRTAIVNGIPFAARASRHPAIASRMFSIASSSVRPCDTHPGIAGHSATSIPVSSGSNVTRSFIPQCDRTGIRNSISRLFTRIALSLASGRAIVAEPVSEGVHVLFQRRTEPAKRSDSRTASAGLRALDVRRYRTDALPLRRKPSGGRARRLEKLAKGPAR